MNRTTRIYIEFIVITLIEVGGQKRAEAQLEIGAEKEALIIQISVITGKWRAQLRGDQSDRRQQVARERRTGRNRNQTGFR